MIAGLDAFLRDHAAIFETIARFSRDRPSPDDVRNEAWLKAAEYALETGAIDLADEIQAREILKRVRRVFERPKRIARMTRSLDQPLGGDDGPSLLELMADDDGAHPLSLLEELETQASAPEPFEFPDPYHSELAAWNCLLRRFELRMRALAAFLMISPSWCFQLRRRIRTRFDAAQHALPQAAGFVDDDGALQPWRRFKLPVRNMEPDLRQRALDFWCMPAQPMTGQLWLL
jgi:hypothetical protein